MQIRSVGIDLGKTTFQLIPAQFVKPFVKSNKNDFIDAKQSPRH